MVQDEKLPGPVAGRYCRYRALDQETAPQYRHSSQCYRVLPAGDQDTCGPYIKPTECCAVVRIAPNVCHRFGEALSQVIVRHRKSKDNGLSDAVAFTPLTSR